MKVFAIGYTQRECFGHGDYRDVTHVSINHPVFTEREKAEECLKKIEYNSDYKVVELDSK